MSPPGLTTRRYSRCWRKSRIAARILIRGQEGRLTKRDIALAAKLHADADVSPRLLNQGVASLLARKRAA